jgi:heme oxygenase (biliverdin-IX-beta and delta-forming)
MKTQSFRPLLEALRLHTHASHQALQEKFDITNRIQNKESYGNLLLTLYNFYNEIEPLLIRWESDFTRLGIDFKIRQKIPKLLADITILDLSERLSCRPNCDISELPDLQTLGQAVGCLYVLEGSTLGAQVICQHLREVFGSQGASFPMSFYQSYGPETRNMWREFCDFIFRYSLEIKTTQEQQEVLTSARQTFESLGKWLGQ